MKLFGRRFTHQENIPEIAIAHDYLTQRGGAERVVLALHRAFPEAPIYTTLYNPEKTYPEFKNCRVITSPLNRVPIFREDHRLALPLLPFFSRMMRPKAKIVIASSTGWAHGFNLPQKTLVYCHSPARWIYLADQYLGDMANPIVAKVFKVLRPFLYHWDQKAAQKQKYYVANSTTIQKRIYDVYGKEVDIIFPPFSVQDGDAQEPIEDLQEFMGKGYFLIVSRLLPYKNVQHAVEAFKNLDSRLLVIGAGPLKNDLLDMAPNNVAFASNLTDAQMRYAYSHATALIAISHEDFGITPLEGGAFGKPTIALKAGGFLDTIVEGVNGVFIMEPTPKAIEQAVRYFNPGQFEENEIRSHIQKFSEERFRKEILEKINYL